MVLVRFHGRGVQRSKKLQSTRDRLLAGRWGRPTVRLGQFFSGTDHPQPNWRIFLPGFGPRQLRPFLLLSSIPISIHRQLPNLQRHHYSTRYVQRCSSCRLDQSRNSRLFLDAGEEQSDESPATHENTMISSRPLLRAADDDDDI